LTLILAAVFLGETMTWRLILGVALMSIGSLITLK
jgi:drug/metabolite transporter (DMT)-like permease